MSVAQVIVKTIAGVEYPASGVWRAGRWWPCGSDGTIVEIVPHDLSALEAAVVLKNQDRLGNIALDWAPGQLAALTDAQVAALNAESGGIAPTDIATSTAAPGVIEDSSTRSNIGERALAVLQADARLDVEVA